MYDSACLGGQVILVVEGEPGPFPLELQAALERMGAETLLARSPAHARDHASRFDISAAVINCGETIDRVEFRLLLKELGGMPLLLYGAEPPSYVSPERAPFLATPKPSRPEAIVRAVVRMLSS